MSYKTQGDQVKSMFASIAKGYDRTNDVLSLGVHYLWRQQLLRRMSPCDRVLDVASGTGALVPYLLKKAETVVASDFCQEMLDHMPAKIHEDPRVSRVQADAMDLEFPDNSFDCVSVAFGVRNFEELNRGLSELLRVLKPGGQLLVLEFGQVRGLMKYPYEFYSFTLMPLLGGLLTGDKEAYKYLPRTAAEFPCDEKFADILEGVGFVRTEVTSLWFGMSYIYSAHKIED